MGTDGAEDIVRAAARPLLRRPWQTLTLAPTGRDDVALGFAGERGGVAVDAATGTVAAFDGELFSTAGVTTGTSAAAELLDAYLAEGSSADPEGCFAAAVWDPREEELTFLTDRYGRRSIWTGRVGRSLVAAGEIKGLVAAGLEPRLDPDTWAEFLAYEHAIGEHGPLEGVNLVPAASALTVGLSGRERLHTRWRYRLEPDADGDLAEWTAEFERLLHQAVARRLDPKAALALSGGLDSRAVAAVLGARGQGAVALTYGAPGSSDLRLGTQVAAAAGFRHRSAPFQPGYIARGAKDAVWLSEGDIRCFHVHHSALRGLRESDGVRSVFICYGGDHAVRTVGGPLKTGGDGVLPDNFHAYRASCVDDALAEELFTPAFAGRVRGVAREAMRRAFSSEPGEPLEQAREAIFWAQRRKIWPGAELFVDELAPRDPYDDRDLLDFCRRMPEHFRVGGVLQRAYLNGFLDLAAVPNARDELPVALNGTRRRAAEFRIRARRALRTRIDARLGTGWSPRRGGIGDYATDLRLAGRGLLEVLLEPRTLARRQIRAEPARRLVEETLSGRAKPRHTRALGVLLTFELFQRQFVDGDGSPRAYEAHKPEAVGVS
jgi:asparagine synthase